jgi:hypothetical protein
VTSGALNLSDSRRGEVSPPFKERTMSASANDNKSYFHNAETMRTPTIDVLREWDRLPDKPKKHTSLHLVGFVTVSVLSLYAAILILVLLTRAFMLAVQ